MFFRLAALRPGDRVFVRRADGTVIRFEVSTVAQYRKTAFPTRSVYGMTSRPELRLITCGGRFDRVRGSYLSNVVVYAALAVD